MNGFFKDMQRCIDELVAKTGRRIIVERSRDGSVVEL
jgi:hypothetical protein